MHLIHVRRRAEGTWTVQPDDRPEPVSEHPDQDQAELAAVRYAAGNGGGEIVVNDRYRFAHVSPRARGITRIAVARNGGADPVARYLRELRTATRWRGPGRFARPPADAGPSSDR